MNKLSKTETFTRSDFSSTTVDGQSRWVASRDFTVNIVYDTVDEPFETFTVRLAYVGPSQPHLLRGDFTATVTTTDDIDSLADLRTTATLTEAAPSGETRSPTTGRLATAVRRTPPTRSSPQRWTRA